MRSPSLLGVLLSLPLLLAPLVRGGTSDHRYKPGEHVELWVNKVRTDTSMGPMQKQRCGRWPDFRLFTS
jgi:hypothetical protein